MKYTIVNSITSNTVCGGPVRRRSSDAISRFIQYEPASGCAFAVAMRRSRKRIIAAAALFSAR